MVERDGVSASPCQGREEGEMAPTPQWRFGPFCPDPASGCLWRAETLVPLRPKPFALLAYLVAHAGQVVSKARLFEAVWPETVVSEGMLKDYIKQIRKALDDTPRTSQYIATVHRRGYRFVALVTTLEGSRVETAAQRTPVAIAGTPGTWSPARRAPGLVVAREGELAQFQQWWAMAQQGRRQLVLISGEAGIGKTTLVDAFVAQVTATQTVGVGYGQCISSNMGRGKRICPCSKPSDGWGAARTPPVSLVCCGSTRPAGWHTSRRSYRHPSSRGCSAAAAAERGSACCGS